MRLIILRSTFSSPTTTIFFKFNRPVVRVLLHLVKVRLIIVVVDIISIMGRCDVFENTLANLALVIVLVLFDWLFDLKVGDFFLLKISRLLTFLNHLN